MIFVIYHIMHFAEL